jgi:GNAT superfamily N-acetyltransferase
VGDTVKDATETVRTGGGAQPRVVRLDRDTEESALLRAAVLRHRLAPGQTRFVGLPVMTLPIADADPDRVPFAIVVGPVTDAAEAREHAAGFGVLDSGVGLRELVDEPQRAVLLRAYYLTPQWQGRGVGRASCSAPLLDRLAVEVAPHAERIVLCVNQANQQAQRALARGHCPSLFPARSIVSRRQPLRRSTRHLAIGRDLAFALGEKREIGNWLTV